jgi:hypothetical protein
MLADVWERCNAIEECYEYLLAYAAQGLPSDEGSQSGSQVRVFLEKAVKAMHGLPEAFASAVAAEGLQPVARYDAFLRVIERDTNDSLAALEMVLAQSGISSQLIDNLNASIHLRALLTDLFLIGEILRGRVHAKPVVLS